MLQQCNTKQRESIFGVLDGDVYRVLFGSQTSPLRQIRIWDRKKNSQLQKRCSSFPSVARSIGRNIRDSVSLRKTKPGKQQTELQAKAGCINGRCRLQHGQRSRAPSQHRKIQGRSPRLLRQTGQERPRTGPTESSNGQVQKGNVQAVTGNGRREVKITNADRNLRLMAAGGYSQVCLQHQASVAFDCHTRTINCTIGSCPKFSLGEACWFR